MRATVSACFAPPKTVGINERRRHFRRGTGRDDFGEAGRGWLLWAVAALTAAGARAQNTDLSDAPISTRVDVRRARLRSEPKLARERRFQRCRVAGAGHRLALRS